MIRLYIRSDLSFHENQDEDQKGRYHRRSHHPGGKRLLVTKGTNEPTSLVRGGDREARWHVEFLKVNKDNVLILRKDTHTSC